MLNVTIKKPLIYEVRKMIGIYKITNKVNNKVYVGQSINIKERWQQHIYKAFNEKEIAYNSAIHQAFRKYGIENFSFEIIEELTDVNELDNRERFWIKELDCLTPNGYNILVGGQAYRAAPHVCEKCGKPISNNAKLCRECYNTENRKHLPTSEELKKCLLDNNGNFSAVGRIYNVSSTNVAKWCKGYKMPYHSSDYKTVSQKQEKVKKQVAQIDMQTGEIINIFNNTNEAARSLGKNKGSHICEVCNGKLKQCYGFFWKYI